MKKLMIIIGLFAVCGYAHADVYVVTAPDDSIYSLSERNDAVCPDGYSVNIIRKKMIADLEIGDDLSLYDFQNKSFKLNSERLQAKLKKQEDAIVSKQKRDAARASAVTKLKALGLTDNEVAEIVGGRE